MCTYGKRKRIHMLCTQMQCTRQYDDRFHFIIAAWHSSIPREADSGRAGGLGTPMDCSTLDLVAEDDLDSEAEEGAAQAAAPEEAAPAVKVKVESFDRAMAAVVWQASGGRPAAGTAGGWSGRVGDRIAGS